MAFAMTGKPIGCQPEVSAMAEDLSADDDEDSRRDGARLERRTVETFEEWGYFAKRGETLIQTEVDVVASRKEFRQEPTDFVVAECKNWTARPIGPPVIFRLVMQAYIGHAMPVLVHTTRLTERAWTLAQAYDIRLLTDKDLYEHDDLPPLPEWRPPSHRRPHRRPLAPSEYQEMPSPVLIRHAGDSEAPVLGGPAKGPCYVTDRSGHGDYGPNEK
jgi:hypothetical protein